MTAALAVAALALASGSARAMDVTGPWLVNDGKAEVAIMECPEGLCGKLLTAKKIVTDPDAVDRKNKNPSLRLRKLKGLSILTGFVGGPTEWRDGVIYNPDDGNTYRATMKVVDEDTLRVTGCVLRILCKSAKLTRPGAAAKAAGHDGFALAKGGE